MPIALTTRFALSIVDRHADDLRRDKADAAPGADGVGHRARNPGRATDGIAGTIDVVMQHHGMHRECSLGRRVAIVAVVPAPDRLQFRVVGELVHNLQHRAIRERGKRRAGLFRSCFRDRRRQRSCAKEALSCAVRLHNQIDVAIDGSSVGREVSLELRLVGLGASDVVVAPFTDDDAVVDLGHRCPRHLAPCHLVEEAIEPAGLAVNLPHVVQADVPFEAISLKRVQAAAEFRMTLEYEHALAVEGEQRSGGETTGTRSDDDGVKVLVKVASRQRALETQIRFTHPWPPRFISFSHILRMGKLWGVRSGATYLTRGAMCTEVRRHPCQRGRIARGKRR
jgi:hypothetical protein